MPLSDIVNVVISAQNPGVTQPGFGVILIPSHTVGWAERYRTYGVLSDVAADFAINTAEYQAAEAVFSQSPSVTKVLIGRFSNHPTQSHQIGLVTLGPTGTVYKVRLNDLTNGGNSRYAQYTSVAGDTNDTIMAGLLTAINALAMASLHVATISGPTGSHVITVTAVSAGVYNGIEVFDSTPGTVGQLMSLTETTGDAGIAADLTALAAATPDWYGFATIFQSEAILQNAAAWCEANNKLFVPTTADTSVPNSTEIVGGTDIGDVLTNASYARSAPFFHPRNDEFAGFAELGKFFPITPGGENWRLKTLATVTPAIYTPTQITNLKAKNMNFYYVLAGANVIGGDGQVAANEYIDVIRFRDSWSADVQTRIANLLIQNDKVPFTDAGIGLVEAEVRAANDDGIAAGGISPNPKPTVSVPLAANISQSDKQARTLRSVNTVWELAGAINNLTVNAQVTA